MSVFGVILVFIFPCMDWITPNSDTFHPVIWSYFFKKLFFEDQQFSRECRLSEEVDEQFEKEKQAQFER